MGPPDRRPVLARLAPYTLTTVYISRKSAGKKPVFGMLSTQMLVEITNKKVAKHPSAGQIYNNGNNVLPPQNFMDKKLFVRGGC